MSLVNYFLLSSFVSTFFPLQFPALYVCWWTLLFNGMCEIFNVGFWFYEMAYGLVDVYGVCKILSIWSLQTKEKNKTNSRFHLPPTAAKRRIYQLTITSLCSLGKLPRALRVPDPARPRTFQLRSFMNFGLSEIAQPTYPPPFFEQFTCDDPPDNVLLEDARLD